MIVAMICVAGAEAQTSYCFSEGALPDGFLRVTDRMDYSDSRGFGWMPDQQNVFGVELPEGNYTVSIQFSSPEAAAAATVKAESRRLVLQSGGPAESKVRRVSVNLRRPEIEGGGTVRLHDREKYPESGSWDERLTLEFFPGTEGLEGIQIEPSEDIVMVYIAGDSTVTDQVFEPYCGWGQMLPRFFAPDVVVANHAESGRALYSFRYEKRLDKILSVIRPGDYLFIQFGHNDQKNKKEGAGPFTTYKADLEDYISKVREQGGIPVLVTPMERLRWKDGKLNETLTEFAEAVKRVGEEQGVPVIDLHAMSLLFYAALGEDDSATAFAVNNGKLDRTHHSNYGAYELARCIVESIKVQVPELRKYLRSDAGSFNPSQPDDPDLLCIPASAGPVGKKPEGS